MAWVSGCDRVHADLVDKLETLLTSKGEKDQLGHEDEYWAGMEAGLPNISKFKCILCATDGSQSLKGIGAGLYRHDTGTGGCCRIGNSDVGKFSNRSEHAAAELELENLLTTDENIVVITDSGCLLDLIQPWIGEGCNLMIHKFPDGDILRDKTELLR